MSKTQKVASVVLVLLLGVAVYGLFRTNPSTDASRANSIDQNPAAQEGQIDQTPLAAAQRLAALAEGDDEAPLAKEALRLADHEVDLAFAAELRNAAEHPQALSPEAQEFQSHLREAESALENDKALVERLTAAEAKAEGQQKGSLSDELEIAKAQLELDRDEVDDAKQDLMRAGGDPRGRIQAMVQAHEAAAHDLPSPAVTKSSDWRTGGLIRRLQESFSLRQKYMRLAQSRDDTLSAAAALSTKHDALMTQVVVKKGVVAKRADAAGQAEVPESAKLHAGGPKVSISSGATRTHEQAAIVVKATKERSAQQNQLATFDKRIETYKDLAGVYEKWAGVVATKQRATIRQVIWGFTAVLLILLLAMVFSTWLERLLGKLRLARRQVDTLRAVMRLTMQIFAVLLTLLVIFGPPGQLGTFLGLAGAGLTVALKDFIISFVGWFVLMGRNGIRIGDWVEINGVSGEVVELGMFHTVLLETGNWTDSGHPTGRRVTFTNSFAIEGHYFNFSTSGQWLWDELQIVLPAGRDPFPIVDAIQKKVMEVTEKSAGLAEQEWQHAARSRDMSALSAAPAINVRPVIGGIELAVRYITRANERYQLRAKLYHAAMDLLSVKNIPVSEDSVAKSPAATASINIVPAATSAASEIAHTKG